MAIQANNKQRPQPRTQAAAAAQSAAAANLAKAASGARGASYRTWGLRRRPESLEIYDPQRHPFIARVREHLGLEFIEIKGDGEPLQIALGHLPSLEDPDANIERVTPFFSTYDSLDYFCRLNLQTYLAVDEGARLPRRWFWQEAARSSRVPGGSGSIVNVATVIAGRSEG